MSPHLSQHPAPPPVSVVVAADRLLIREGFKRLLAVPGMKVVAEAATTDEVLELLGEAPPNVLILDVSLAGPKILGLIRNVRRQYPACRVLLFSMQRENPDVLRLLASGAAAYLNGDLSRQQLLDAIRQVARGATYVSPSLASTLISVHRGASCPAHDALSEREYEVLCLSGSGVSFQQIASELGLSPKTVHTYRGRILAKLGVRSNAAMIRYAIEHRLVPPSPSTPRVRRQNPTGSSNSL